MHRFSYEAVDSKGRRIVDTAEAWDRDSLMINLQSRGIVLVKWLEFEPSGAGLFNRSGKRLSSTEIYRMIKDLGHLLKSAVPMDRALTIIADTAKQESVKTTAGTLKESIQRGSTLSEALGARPGEFNALIVNMIRVGETGGVLPEIMEKLAGFLKRSQEIRRFIFSSSIYPAILFSVGIISVLVVMGFVVPKFAGIFQDLGQEVPFSTRVLILMSDFLRTWGWLLLVAAGAGVFFLWRSLRTEKGRSMKDRWMTKLPFFGELMMNIQVSRFCRTLGTLVMSGVPLLKALSIVKDVVRNSLVTAAVAHIQQHVKEGNRISMLMKDHSVFSATVVQMTALGEETGRLGEMLLLTADELDGTIESDIKTGLAFLEPATILVMGVLIGGIVVSMLSAVFGINDIQF